MKSVVQQRSILFLGLNHVQHVEFSFDETLNMVKFVDLFFSLSSYNLLFLDIKNGLPCARSNQCDINIHTRQDCQACRLNKCFSKGMQVSMFRTCPTPKNKKVIQTKQTYFIVCYFKIFV